MAVGHSEVSMREGDMVELLKVGCAGWWYVRILGKCHNFVFIFFRNTYIIYKKCCGIFSKYLNIFLYCFFVFNINVLFIMNVLKK